jgi:DNA-binding phage protein
MKDLSIAVDKPQRSNQLRANAAAWLREALRVSVASNGRRWTLVALAKTAGVSRATLWSIQEEKADPEEWTLLKVAKALGVPAPDLTATPETDARRRFVDGTVTEEPHLGGSLPDEAQLAMVVAELHRAISHIVADNELTSRAGCHALACGLIAMAGVLRFHGADVAQLDELAYDLKKKSEGPHEERG